MLKTGVALCLCAPLFACASAGDPPGGPEDAAAPLIVVMSPESGAVLTSLPDEVVVQFDEVIQERVAGSPQDISGALMLSPVVENTQVRWRRNRITARPRNGFRPNTVYRLEVLPVVTDLRQNRLRAGRTVVFSTGPAIPGARLSGAVVDWPAARPVPRALVEAVLLPDSLPYRTIADSTGFFDLRQMPPGEYLVYGIVDANSDRRVGTREAFDTVRVTLDTAATAEIYAFPHDTLAPRIRQVEIVDSLTLRLTFDRPLDPTLVLDTGSVHLAPADDTTALFGVEAVLTKLDFDSLRAREMRASRAAADSAAAARRDSTRRDTTRAAARPRPDSAAARPPVRRPPGDSARVRAPLDSTMAQRMIARRAAPSDVRMVRLFRPLEPDVPYRVYVENVRSLTGVVGSTSTGVRPPAARRGRQTNDE